MNMSWVREGGEKNANSKMFQRESELHGWLPG